MFQSDTKLPHVLPSAAYHNTQVFARECSQVMKDAWHLVGTSDELSEDGDFLTTTLSGVPVQVRNFNGEVKALSNVCAHRHATICGQPAGNSKSMRCQYHGWEYQSDGCTGKIPMPKNFVPFEKEALRLPSYEVEMVGKLVFVNVAQRPRSIKSQFGEAMLAKIAEHFGEHWSKAMKLRNEFEVNWKIPIENALESYHVPAVHARTFREDPGAERSQHTLEKEYSSLHTKLPFAPHHWLDKSFQKLEGRYIRWLGFPATKAYEQVHILPNLLFSFTDAISLVQCVIPEGPQACTILTRQFGRKPRSSSYGLRRLMAWLWNKMTSNITRRILLEDQELYVQIQKGLQHSPHKGVLGICEERIFHFQNYISQRASDLWSESVDD